MKKENYIDNIPKINKKWETLEDGIVEVTIENKGFIIRWLRSYLKNQDTVL